MKPTATTAFLSALALAALLRSAMAETIYVDARYGSADGPGTPEAPCKTIQAAIGKVGATEIIVFPGKYSETLSVGKSLKIIGYDGPHTTWVDGSASQNSVINIGRDMDVWIEGLTISSSARDYGVWITTTGTLHMRNCVICSNTSHGMVIRRDLTASSPTAFIYNCVFFRNGGSGLYIETVTSGLTTYNPYVVAFNNIFIGNGRYGIEANVDRWPGYGGPAGTITLDYNDYVGNGLGNYSGLFGPGQEVSAGSHSFSLSPDFVGGSADDCSQDFRLSPTSPCKDAGHPGLGFQDPDGTRNDLGAYGGPGAQNFYTNPNDGPFIRSVTIDQGMVPRGGTFTIRATGAAR